MPAASNLGYWPALVHALIDLGRPVDARRELDQYTAAASIRRLDVRMSELTLAARLHAADGDATAATTTFQAAVELIDAESDVVEQIVLYHHYGKHLRAAGRRREASAQLTAGHELASRAGADPYARRIDVDLRGAEAKTASSTEGGPLATLTARERDVVTLIAAGSTNQEAATALYVSVKAVEYHLGNVYAKLHIGSRRELPTEQGQSAPNTARGSVADSEPAATASGPLAGTWSRARTSSIALSAYSNQSVPPMTSECTSSPRRIASANRGGPPGVERWPGLVVAMPGTNGTAPVSNGPMSRMR
jgi:DNA-binding NarL/FixJ family response regulator